MQIDGARGKSRFARRLGLSPSTYEYYETTRVPPAGVLVKIAEVTGADLRWLLTGQAAQPPVVPPEHPIVRRVVELLERNPQAAEPLAAFLDILSESMKFPPKRSTQQPKPPAGRAGQLPQGPPGREAWIAVLGRSAAGVPHFWSSKADQQGIKTLKQIVQRRAAGDAVEVQSAEVAPSPLDEQAAAQLIRVNVPDEDNVCEFVVAEQVRRRYGDVFAVRIDGDSMAPDIRHGDIVLLSPSVPAVDGQPAVVQLRGQIGVTCKLYRRQGRRVHLVPINEQFAPQAFPAEKVDWALRVLGRIRPGRNPHNFAPGNDSL